MSEFIDMLRQRLNDAQKRLLDSQTHLQEAQAKHQAVAQEFSSLQTLINIEMAKAQGSLQPGGQPQPVGAQPGAPFRVVISPRPTTAPAPMATPQPHALPGVAESPAINQTEMIREVLRQHTNGITPAQVWIKVKEHVERNYVYSVLKRMKDKGEVKERRGKYYLQVDSGKGGESNDSSVAGLVK